jgi:hypothetical protein
MIKQKMGETTLKGDANIVLSELTALTNAIAKAIETKDKIPYETTIEMLQKSLAVYKLTDAGMGVEEAMDVLDMKKNIKKVVVTEKDGSTEVIKGDCYDG